MAVRGKGVLDAVGRGWLPWLMIAVSTSDATQTSICGYPTVAHGSSKLRDCTNPSFSKTAAPLRQEYQCYERGNHILKQKKVNLDMTLRTSAPSTWGIQPHF